MLIVAPQGVSDYQHGFNKQDGRSAGIRNWPLSSGLFTRLYNEMPLVYQIVAEWTAYLPLNTVLDAQCFSGERGMLDVWSNASSAWIEYNGVANHVPSWPYRSLRVPSQLYGKTRAYVYQGRFLGREMKTWWDMPDEKLRYVFLTEDETRPLTERDFFDAVISALKKVIPEST